MSRSHAAVVLLDNTTSILYVNNCIAQQVIIDTGAVCVMMSKRYALVYALMLSLEDNHCNEPIVQTEWEGRECALVRINHWSGVPAMAAA